MEQILINAGLSELQSKAYLYLIEHGECAPKLLTTNLKITRTNAYKVLESLEELGLVNKVDRSKKIMYSPADPSVLSSLVAEKRNNIIALEQNVNQAMQQLRNSYSKHTDQLKISSKVGKASMLEAYENQAKQKKPIFFMKTRSDIPFMGFETMDSIRKLQGRESPNRYGITPDAPEGALNKKIDESTKLTRTWIDENLYTAPVEWSVSGNSLLIQIFDNKGSVISINNSHVAEAFKQIWHVADDSIRSNPKYKLMPHKAKRLV